MITVLTGKPTPFFTSDKCAVDPATLDRWADILVSQGFERQGSRLAVLADERRGVAQ